VGEGMAPNWNPATNRHAECEDCHNPHLAGSGLSAQGSNSIANVLARVWGVAVTNIIPTPGSFATPSYTRVAAPLREYELCLKCHSGYGYGSTPPNTTNPLGTPVPQVDMSAAFNPNNYAHHAVEATGKNQPGSKNPNFANTFVSPWGPSSTVQCNDCHRAVAGAGTATPEPAGSHGSSQKYLLATVDYTIS